MQAFRYTIRVITDWLILQADNSRLLPLSVKVVREQYSQWMMKRVKWLVIRQGQTTQLCTPQSSEESNKEKCTRTKEILDVRNQRIWQIPNYCLWLPISIIRGIIFLEDTPYTYICTYLYIHTSDIKRRNLFVYGQQRR